MTHFGTGIVVPVDVTNPAQFFACCGLLELADRLWPGGDVTAEFIRPRFERSHFRLFSTCQLSIQTMVTALCASKRKSVDPYQPIKKNGTLVRDVGKIKPVLLDIPRDHKLGNEMVSIRLGWWLDELAGQQLDDFKLWGAHQTAEGLINDMANAVRVEKINDQTVLEESVGMMGRIGLDSRSSWNALDEGFSPNNQKLPVETYAATELLAAVGLETFKPYQNDGYVYTCWIARLPAVVARAAVCGCISVPDAIRYHFQVGKRGKFGYFSKASRL